MSGPGVQVRREATRSTRDHALRSAICLLRCAWSADFRSPARHRAGPSRGDPARHHHGRQGAGVGPYRREHGLREADFGKLVNWSWADYLFRMDYDTVLELGRVLVPGSTPFPTLTGASSCSFFDLAMTASEERVKARKRAPWAPFCWSRAKPDRSRLGYRSPSGHHHWSEPVQC